MSDHSEQSTSCESAVEAIRRRHAVRKFSEREVSDETLRGLLELANRSPSGFNLQPWHFIIVRDPVLRNLLSHVALDQRQVSDAPATVVFVSDPSAYKTTYPKVLKIAVEQGALSSQAAKRYRNTVRLLFLTGPLNVIGFFKNIGATLHHLMRPTPKIIATKSEAGHYVMSQTMLAAATFMIAAKAAGLDTSPMEGFDEYRLKKLLAIPPRMRVGIIVAVGYAAETGDKVMSVRLPLEEKLSINQFSRSRITQKS